MSQIIPIPKIPVSVRIATMDDLPFIDALQKKHSKQLGFFPRAQMEGYLKNEWVLIAEDPSTGSGLGYVASRDRYQKRDELGAIFQLCVADGAQRKLVGATLIKSVFERAPYGCRLFCCWCAQDLEANRFWEAMGFVPLAFRTGGRHKGTKAHRHEGEDDSVPSCLSGELAKRVLPVPSARIHIFWQRRIRHGDTQTPYWFPSQTNSGSIREDRLVLPIPPGVKWDDVMPIILPKENENDKLPSANRKQIEGPKSKSRAVSLVAPSPRALGGWSFTPPASAKSAPAERKPRERVPRQRVKNNPMHIAAARELRDRWLEQVNAGEYRIESSGKYEVSRAIEERIEAHADQTMCLPSEKRRLMTAA